MITGDFKKTELNITVVINVVRAINLLVLIKNEWMNWERAKVGWAGILRVRGRLYNKPTAKFPDVTVKFISDPNSFRRKQKKKHLEKPQKGQNIHYQFFNSHKTCSPPQLKKQKKKNKKIL